MNLYHVIHVYSVFLKKVIFQFGIFCVFLNSFPSNNLRPLICIFPALLFSNLLYAYL